MKYILEIFWACVAEAIKNGSHGHWGWRPTEAPASGLPPQTTLWDVIVTTAPSPWPCLYSTQIYMVILNLDVTVTTAPFPFPCVFIQLKYTEWF
jgi:hypothetical protein